MLFMPIKINSSQHYHYAGNGKGEKDMVILPYKDRLLMFSRYLQQLLIWVTGSEMLFLQQGSMEGLMSPSNCGLC